MTLQKYILKENDWPYENEDQKMFHEELAMAQRGEPETIMVKIQHLAGGGVLPFVIEHVGDLTNRMALRVLYDTAGYDYVGNKVDKSLYVLESRYGFEKEFKENIKTNAQYDNKSYEELMEQVTDMLQDYANAHKKLPVFNRMQELARDSAVALGEMRFDDAVKKLKILQAELNKGIDNWKDKALRVEFRK